jgi:type IV pilus assembly protein PilP
MQKSKSMSKNLLLVFMVPLMLTAGCKKEQQPAPQPPPAPKQEMQQAPPVQQQLSSAQAGGKQPSASGDFATRKDPFKPYVVETKAVPVFQKGSGAGMLPIQNYEVGQFRVLGIVAGLKQNSALVVDPTGKAYVVKPGMEIGKNGGVVEKVTANSVDILEKYRDETGKIRKRITKLTLPRKD